MKKAITIVLVFALVIGSFSVGLFVGTYKPGYDLEKSTVYSDEDIRKCAKLAEKDLYFSGVKCYPVKIYYSDTWLDYTKSCLNGINGADDVKNVLTIKADYLTGRETQAQEPYSYFYGWNFIFYRKDANSPWVLYDQGYG